jgi:methyltransferase (TIGR00027 family)
LKEHHPSTTARVVAFYRAVESKKPEDERICHDPYAHHFISPKISALKKKWLQTSLNMRIYEWLFPGIYAYFAVRTRYIDDYLQWCLDHDYQQVVVLGAGYDSRAYRFHQFKDRIKIFEVDHPATQGEKKAKLTELFGALPGHVVYVPIDFHTQTLSQRLFESGYDRRLRTVFIWEGVTYYLSAKAVEETLAFVADHSGPESSILFDYTYANVIAGTSPLKEARLWRKFAKKRGEPLLFGIQEGMIEQYLAQRGFTHVTDAQHEILQQRYLTGINQKRYLTSILAIVHATVKPN